MKEELLVRNLQLSGNKSTLLVRLAHLKEEENDAVDDTVKNDDDDETIGLYEETI